MLAAPRPWAFLLVATLAAAAPASAQSAPPATQPAASAAAGATPIQAKVIEVVGDVLHAPLDSREWKPCAVGDTYPARTKIQTGVRSSIKLQVGEEEPYTCMLIDSVGRTVISEAYKTQTSKRVRVGVAYGRVRAGVAEGGLQSDFTVDSPVATLSKRGTWGFEMYYERDTNIFEIGLTERGLVEALNKVTGQQREVNPKELVTEAMRRWLDQSQIIRNVAVADIPGQSDIEVAFNRLDQEGLGVTNVGSGKGVLLDLSNQAAQNDFAQLAQQSLSSAVLPPIQFPTGPQLREEGFFGTGRGDQLIQVLIDSNSPLAQRGLARPGKITFRRDALEGWLKHHRGGK